MKLKGIDGGPHKRRNMWFNSMIREVREGPPREGDPARCCMVVVSSCREVSA